MNPRHLTISIRSFQVRSFSEMLLVLGHATAAMHRSIWSLPWVVTALFYARRVYSEPVQFRLYSVFLWALSVSCCLSVRKTSFLILTRFYAQYPLLPRIRFMIAFRALSYGRPFTTLSHSLHNFHRYHFMKSIINWIVGQTYTISK